MKIAFRVDASPQIGNGHLSRCLSLAQCLQTKGAKISFILSSISCSMQKTLEEQHFIDVKLLQGNDEIAACKELLAADFEWLVIDHYLLGIEYEEAMRSVVSKIAVIDDLIRSHNCDLLIDQNFGRKNKDYRDKVPKGCRILTGPAYALLETSFREERQEGLRARKQLDKTLCYFGGGDVENIIMSVIESLDERRLSFDLVLGNNDFPAVRQRAAKSKYCSLHDYVENMAKLMNEASLFIGSGGMTNWERCCLGLPSLIATVAENQVPATEALAEKGALLYLGPAEDVRQEQIVHSLATLEHSPQLLMSLGQRASEVVDGRGTERVAMNMVSQKIYLQLAQQSDCEDLWKWRNAEENRKFSHDDSVIPLTNHQQWFAKTLESMNRELLIAYLDGEAVGVLRFDLTADEALVSIYLVPGHHGKGLGEGILRAGEMWLRNNRLSIRRVRAEIQKINKPSEKVFHHAGYEETFGVWYLELD